MRKFQAVVTALLLFSSTQLWAGHEYESGFSNRDAAILRAVVDIGSILRGQAPVYSSTNIGSSRYPSYIRNDGYDSSRKASKKHRKAHRKHIRKHANRELPPGLRNRNKPLPPGWQRKLRAGMTFPHAWNQYAKPAPAHYYNRYVYIPGTELVQFDRQVARIASDTRLVLDVLDVLTGR